MRVSFINVGYGDSILVEYEHEGRRFNMLVDGGKPEIEHYLGFPGRIRTIDYLREKRIGRIDLLVITHLHEDHVGGLLEVVKEIDIGELWCSYMFPDKNTGISIRCPDNFCEGAVRLVNSLNIYNEICCIMKSRGRTVREITRTSLNFNIYGDLHMDIFSPEKALHRQHNDLIDSVISGKAPEEAERSLKQLDGFINNMSIVLRLLYKGKKVLLAGDVYNSYWKRLVQAYIPFDADIVKLPHHGHGDGFSIEMAEEINPGIIVVSVSNDRTDKCPDPEMINLFGGNSGKTGKRAEFYFTDAVEMPPYSSTNMQHKAVSFKLNGTIECSIED